MYLRSNFFANEEETFTLLHIERWVLHSSNMWQVWDLSPWMWVGGFWWRCSDRGNPHCRPHCLRACKGSAKHKGLCKKWDLDANWWWSDSIQNPTPWLGWSWEAKPMDCLLIKLLQHQKLTSGHQQVELRRELLEIVEIWGRPLKPQKSLPMSQVRPGSLSHPASFGWAMYAWM